MSNIELINIIKYFESKCILKKVNFFVKEGEIMSLLGPSGCGKSTTLKVIAGLEKPDEGRVLIDNRDMNDVPTEKRGTVIVFQDYMLFPHINVRKNIGFGLKMQGKSKNYINQKVLQLIKTVQLEGLEDKYPSQLSGGQKQRVAIARALAVEPKVLLLDEPFASLDINIRNTMRQFIMEIQKKFKITTILVTHDKEEALMMSDYIAVMIDGKIIQYGTPRQVYEQPACREVANFFGNKNYIKGILKINIFSCEFGSFKLNCDKSEINREAEVMINAENIKICRGEKGLGEAYIVNKKYGGDRTYYILRCGDKKFECIDTINPNFKIGDKVCFKIEAQNMILL